MIESLTGAGVPWRSLPRKTQHRTSDPTNSLVRLLAVGMAGPDGTGRPYVDAVLLAAMQMADESDSRRRALESRIRKIESGLYVPAAVTGRRRGDTS